MPPASPRSPPAPVAVKPLSGSRTRPRRSSVRLSAPIPPARSAPRSAMRAPAHWPKRAVRPQSKKPSRSNAAAPKRCQPFRSAALRLRSLSPPLRQPRLLPPRPLLRHRPIDRRTCTRPGPRPSSAPRRDGPAPRSDQGARPAGRSRAVAARAWRTGLQHGVQPREGGRPKEIDIPSSRPAPGPERPAIEPPKGKEVRTEARARPEMVEDEESRAIKRGGKLVRTPVKAPRRAKSASASSSPSTTPSTRSSASARSPR